MEKTKLKNNGNMLYRIFSMVILVILAILFIFPIYWIITGSFKAVPQAIPPEWFPSEFTGLHYEKLFRQPAWRWLFNSVAMAVLSMALVLIASSMAGYVLAKKRFTGRKIIFSLLICAMALPKQVVLVPLVRIMNFIGLYDSLWAVILPTVGWPFGTFLMKQFSETIPTELLEAAKIDWANEAMIFTNVVCPVIKPAFGALAIFTFINTWNDYFLQLVMLASRRNLSISLGIATLQAEMSTDYGLIMAGATLGALPIVIIFLAFQKYFTNGITMGAVKG